MSYFYSEVWLIWDFWHCFLSVDAWSNISFEFSVMVKFRRLGRNWKCKLYKTHKNGANCNSSGEWDSKNIHCNMRAPDKRGY